MTVLGEHFVRQWSVSPRFGCSLVWALGFAATWGVVRPAFAGVVRFLSAAALQYMGRCDAVRCSASIWPDQIHKPRSTGETALLLCSQIKRHPLRQVQLTGQWIADAVHVEVRAWSWSYLLHVLRIIATGGVFSHACTQGRRPTLLV